MKKLRWGILATGYIAGRFADGLATSHTGELIAVSSRSLKSAQTFASKYGRVNAYASQEELLSQPDVDAVYIATPHPFHAELAIAAAKAGKHILCEKPIAMNMAETEAVISAAETAGVTLVEAYMYRCHPQSAKVVELIKKGKIGKVRLIQAAFGFNAPFDPSGRLFAKELGGGAILDVGGYPASFACMIADTASDSENIAVKCVGGLGRIDPRCETDTIAIANLEFENGIAAQISVSTQLNQNNIARVYGEKGSIEIPLPWIVARDGGEWSFDISSDGKDKPKKITGNEPRGLYGVEADCFAEIVAGQKPSAPCMRIPDTRRVNTILEDWQNQLKS
ncbi:Oxidoreductase family, NAD-binding Rossmann fold protein [Verrucomicrobiia bacterium DG1235]|nr:Oxidoreductase family, NAD-binding Rossmann fold protein [Verrucomicrobiae bacterium DG1235]